MISYHGYGSSGGNISCFDCEIKLFEPRVFKYLDTIQGQVIINTQTKVHFKNLRIQLEGETRCRFQSKLENGLTHHLKTETFFPSEESKTLDPDRMCVYIIGKKDKANIEESKTFPRGEHIFPFQLELTGSSFPSTFQTSFGSIEYRLGVHAISRRDDTGWSDVSPNSIRVRIKGHLNLSSDPSLSKPFTLTKKKKSKSVFTKQPISKVSLHLEHRGYLPSSRILCQVFIKNPTWESITSVQVDLVQRINFYDNKACKTSATLLDSVVNSFESVEREIKCVLSLVVPADAEPTFSLGQKFIEILYFLEFSVTTMSGLTVKDEAGIIIGTCDKERVGSSSTSSARHKEPEDEWDCNFNQQTSVLPPSYSSVASRKPIVEALPPPPSYNKAVGIDDWEEFNPFRPR